MAELFKNNVSATLASTITATSTTLALATGDGAQFPVIANGAANTFRISLWDKSGNVEIISICRRESGSDTLYVGTGTSHQSAGNVAGRGMESTTALAITSSDYHVINMNITAAQIQAALEASSLSGLTSSVAELNILTGVTATATEINNSCDHSNPALLGDTTAGRILRTVLVTLSDGVGANTIRVTMASRFNGDAFTVTSDIARGATVANVTLQATNGYYVDLADALFTGSVVGVLSCCQVYGCDAISASSTSMAFDADVQSGGIRITASRGSNSVAIDSLVDGTNTTTIKLLITYLTDA